jgi:hypothetical protein
VDQGLDSLLLDDQGGCLCASGQASRDLKRQFSGLSAPFGEPATSTSLPMPGNVKELFAFLYEGGWPRQTGQTVSGAPPVPDDGLGKFTDEDGIVCIRSVRGEIAGPERLRALLAAAYGEAWGPAKLEELLSAVGYAGSNIEDWVRNGFFEQHCAGIPKRGVPGFHHLPFIWQIWDGRKDGFSALVNYHKLDHQLLEKVTYTYLGDWIKKQQEAVANEESGNPLCGWAAFRSGPKTQSQAGGQGT